MTCKVMKDFLIRMKIEKQIGIQIELKQGRIQDFPEGVRTIRGLPTNILAKIS